MTADRDFDRLARAWLELSPTKAPDRTIDAVLRVVGTTPQARQPFRWQTWRSPFMPRPMVSAAIAVLILVALGGVILLGQGPSSNVGGATATPTRSATPAASAGPSSSPATAGGPVPSSLQHRWMGGPRPQAGLDAGPGTSILFDATGLALSGPNNVDRPVLSSIASSVGAQTIQLGATAANVIDCAPGQTGTYGWAVSADGRTLTITAGADDCAARLAAVPGTWWLVGCKDTQTQCLGDVAAGTYASQYIAPRIKPGATWDPAYGALTYTVPAGWANSSDWPSTFGLTPSSLYDALPAGSDEGPENIRVIAQPSGLSRKDFCNDTTDPSVPRTVAAEMSWIRTFPGLITTAATPITVGGHAGLWTDVRLDPTWKTRCPGGPAPEVDYLSQYGGIAGTAERERVILLDLGQGDLVAIVIDAATTGGFAGFVAQATPIVDSFQFR